MSDAPARAATPGRFTFLEPLAIALLLTAVATQWGRLPDWRTELGRFQMLGLVGFGAYALAVARRGRWSHLPRAGAFVVLVQTGIRFLKESKAHVVKLEGGVRVAEQIKTLVKNGIPVIGHLGMTPQSVNAFGGFKVQGRNESGDAIFNDALALQEAGCCAIVLELVPAELAERITSALSIPTIGIGAGHNCDAQVLVWTDLMGLTPKPPKFARAYKDLRSEMIAGVRSWIADVENGAFPTEAETFH